MAYLPPAGNAVNFIAAGYVPPTVMAVRFTGADYVIPDPTALAVTLPGYVRPLATAVNFVVPPANVIEGIGAVTLGVVAAGLGEFTLLAVEGLGAVSVDLTSAGTGAHGVAGEGNVEIPMSAAGVGVVERYEVAGEVRLQGILVNRLVRAYRRDTGELVGEQATTAGRFRIHTGFVAREHVIIPIDTAADATDWAPPCANRVLAVLAQDTV